MTWETFDAEWDVIDGGDDPNLPFTAAYVRDDGIRLEMYTWERTHVIEVSDNATHDVITKTTFEAADGRGRLVPLTGWESEKIWRQRPSIAVAALRFAERTWLSSTLADSPVIP